MVSSGIAELDQRLGGIPEGRYFLLTGTPGAGKTSACLHFIAEGLRSGETCAILTQENPEDVFAQAQFIGHDFEQAVADESLLIFQYRLDFSNNYARTGNPRVVADELISLMGGARPSRLVVDSILPFVQAGGLANGAVSALLHVIEELQPTGYFTVPGDLGDSFYARLYDPLVSSAAGVLHFEIGANDIRHLTIRKIRQTPNSTEPLDFVLHAGIGIVEVSNTPVANIPEEASQRVALINTGGFLGGDFFASLRMAYDLRTFESLQEAVPALTNTAMGAVLIALDPLETDPAFAFVHSLRKAGNGVPVVLIASSEGLRAAARARGLRAGADEFITLDASPQEFLSKIESVRARGPRTSAERLKRETLLVQPHDHSGQPLPIPEHEIVRAVSQHLHSHAHPFFAVVRIQPALNTLEQTWQALARRLRLSDGDLIAGSQNGDLVLYLHDISRRHVRELLNRIFDADPRLTPQSVDILYYPADSARIRAWLDAAAPEPLMRAHG